MSQRTCSVEKCERPTKARGFCGMHYQRQRTHGTPHTGRALYRDPEDAFAARTEWRGECLVWTGHVMPNGYGLMAVRGTTMYVHRYAWEREHGSIPDGMLVDHTFHCNRSCTNVEHLRIATKAQNGSNRAAVVTRTTASGERNVYPHGNRWLVRLRHEGVYHRHGVYDTVAEAAVVAERARREVFGEWAGKG